VSNPGSELERAQALRGGQERTAAGRLLREPLVHFLVAGAALFGVHALVEPGATGGDGSHRIELTEDDLRQIGMTWLAQGRPAPTAEEMQRLVEAKVREEVLYREALALGLDQGDTIVKRRLAQKMDFLAEDLAALREPTAQELRAWFEKNSERFALPARVSFRHLYFSPDRRTERARDDAARALARLAAEPADSPAAAGLADPFMLQDYYGERAFGELAASFGPAFAEAVLRLEPGSWQGPIESGYGWHLVFVDALTPSRVPAFEEVEADVRSEWVAEQRDAFKRSAYEAMRARYEIVLPADPTGAPLARASAPQVAVEP
jgi:hypothetical protein